MRENLVRLFLNEVQNVEKNNKRSTGFVVFVDVKSVEMYNYG